MDVDVEQRTVAAFIARDRRERWLTGLASAKRRQETLNRLHDWRDFDERFMSETAGDPAAVASELRTLGAPKTCYVIGGPQDGQSVDLTDALQTATDHYGGVLVCCVPGALAVHLPEAPTNFRLLKRSD